MNNEFRYKLEPYKGIATRYTCPKCGQQRKFVRYIDTETGAHLADNVGKCERENSCGYHFTSKQYFEQNGGFSFEKTENGNKYARAKEIQSKPKTFTTIVADNDFWGTLQYKPENNGFMQYLVTLFGFNTAQAVMSQYFVGTAKGNKTVFWQIDKDEQVRTGKIMQYHPATGKRIKDVPPTWVHSAINLQNFDLKQCFFGEHHLSLFPSKPVAIVESEKTAIIASGYLPNFIWLACGGSQGLTSEKCEVLKGRSVKLYPDLGCFEKWQTRAKELKLNFTISDLLETNAIPQEREQGLDIADYLIRYTTKQFAD